jgi:hypothetical protein
LRAAVDCENLTTNYLRWSDTYADVALPRVRLSLGYRKAIPYIHGRVQISYVSLDFLTNEGVNSLERLSGDTSGTKVPKTVHPTQDPFGFVLRGRWGLEYLIAERVALRVGTSQANFLTFGGGVLLLKQTLAIDFAYLLHDLAGTYQVGLGYRW